MTKQQDGGLFFWFFFEKVERPWADYSSPKISDFLPLPKNLSQLASFMTCMSDSIQLVLANKSSAA